MLGDITPAEVYCKNCKDKTYFVYISRDTYKCLSCKTEVIIEKSKLNKMIGSVKI